MEAKSIKITNRLFLGFSIVVLLTTVLGIFALTQFKTLSGFTVSIHDHPMVVSNAVRDIKTDLFHIQYNLELQLKETNDKEFIRLMSEINSLEDNIENNFILIKNRFLGNLSDLDTAYSSFNELQPVLNRILYLLQNDEQDKAIVLKNDLGSPIILKLDNQIDIMSDFAFGKSEEFYQDAVNTSSQIMRTTIFFLVLIIVLSIISGWLISYSVTKPLKTLMHYVRQMAIGDQDFEVELISNDEIGQLSKSIREMQYNFKEVVNHAKQIADGNYSGEIPPRSEKDELAISLNSMTNSLKLLDKTNSHSDWLKTGQNLLNKNMRGDLTLVELSKVVISTIAEYVNAKIGSLYVFDKDQVQLNLLGTYAFTKRKSLNESILLGEGIVGQSALEKKIISLTDIPEDYIQINSGLGNSIPRNIIAIPFLFNDELKGVIELGSFESWKDIDFEFFSSISEVIGVSFNSCEARVSMTELVLQQQNQANELMTQQEELRATNEELEEKTERLVRSEERMMQQQEELRASNEELEEKTEFLENQRDEINQKNVELEIIRDEIINKAKDLETSSRYKSEFLANMSHELRTPLNSLLILAKNLFDNKDRRLNDDDVKSAEIIYNSGNELLQLINEILDLAKIESGKVSLDIQKVTINELAENIKNQFSSLAQNKGIKLSVQVSKDIPSFITTDRQKINQIIKNLVSNAVKFTIEGSVFVNFKRPEDSSNNRILIEVKDTGIGIPSDKHETVFDAFKQADGSTSRDFGGTGLGLSISRELASLLSGEILLESESDNGSVFSLILPETLEDIPDLNINSNQINPEKVDLKDKEKENWTIEDDRDSISRADQSILIIEDDKNFAAILQKTCHEYSFKSIVSENGEDGLVLAEKLLPDAIILDLKLPGINGLQVLDHLKKNQIIRHIPVHIISGDDRESDVFDKGILGFLQKPIDKDSLNEVFSKIHKVIDKKVKDLLIVEDDDNLRYAIETLIGNSDVFKTSVSTGADALKELAKNKFDCMILDLSLPDISGYELLKELENMTLDYKPPVIIYTGKEISFEEEYELRKYSNSIIIKGVHSQERLLDETSLFLHRIIKELPEPKQQMISHVYNEERIFKDKKVLIVDDDMRNIFAISKIIEQKDMIVEKASTGKKALDLLNDGDQDIDLILMDIMMPEMDGYEAMREIRKIPHFDSIPILALTAKAMKEDRKKCIDAGANDYMTKPIDPERLLSLMRVWLYK